jgi:hypothetical protein
MAEKIKDYREGGRSVPYLVTGDIEVSWIVPVKRRKDLHI